MALDLSEIEGPDDPSKPEFGSWLRYADYARWVKEERRYVWTKGVGAFLETVRRTSAARERLIAEEQPFYRAQVGVIREKNLLADDTTGGAVPFDAARMKPLPDRAKEGRANPARIPVLYMACDVDTAISEMRAGQGESISVAEFRVSTDLRALDLRMPEGGSLPRPTKEALNDREFKEEMVWRQIDSAFSRTVRNTDETAEYVPTQILAELFRDGGFQALLYGSQFGSGTNVVLFDTDDARVVSVRAYEVRRVWTDSQPIGEARPHHA